MTRTPSGTPFGTDAERRSERRQNDAQTRPDQTTVVLTVCCGVSGATCIASNGDLGAASCNATETIEHLDFAPPCDAQWGHEEGAPPAEWLVVVDMKTCPDRPRLRAFCDPCVQYILTTNRFTYCSKCGEEWNPTRSMLVSMERL